MKNKNSKNVQIVDKIKISSEMKNVIEEYKKRTDGSGKTETLISYHSIHETREIKNKKEEKEKTNYNILRYQLEDFYSEVLVERYGLEFNKRMNLNDSRHIAITSMMLQGYDSIEIARMAGHTSLDVQYSYYNHLEFWVDSEVKRLAEEYKYISTSKDKNSDIGKIQEIMAEMSNKAWIVDKEELKYKMGIGYCSDEEMSCPNGFNNKYKGCYECPFWRIELEELNEKRKEIKEDLEKGNQSLKDATDFLIQLHKNGDLDKKREVTIELKNEIKTAAKNLDAEIKKMAKIKDLYENLK